MISSGFFFRLLWILLIRRAFGSPRPSAGINDPAQAIGYCDRVKSAKSAEV
jgi:hypothetical protein